MWNILQFWPASSRPPTRSRRGTEPDDFQSMYICSYCGWFPYKDSPNKVNGTRPLSVWPSQRSASVYSSCSDWKPLTSSAAREPSRRSKNEHQSRGFAHTRATEMTAAWKMSPEWKGHPVNQLKVMRAWRNVLVEVLITGTETRLDWRDWVPTLVVYLFPDLTPVKKMFKIRSG